MKTIYTQLYSTSSKTFALLPGNKPVKYAGCLAVVLLLLLTICSTRSYAQPKVTFDAYAVSSISVTGVPGFADGTVRASGPISLAMDVAGNLYVTDIINNRIIKITPAGVASIFAGSGTAGAADGTGTAAQFFEPCGIAIDKTGNLFVADEANNRVRKISPAGVVTTLAGNDTAGYVNGTGTAAQFNSPRGIYVDAAGNVYVADTYNAAVRKITAEGVVTSFAGTGVEGTADGEKSTAQFANPDNITVDAAGNMYVTQVYAELRKISPAGIVSTIPNGSVFDFNEGLTADAAGNIYVAVDNDNISSTTTYYLVARLTPGGTAFIEAGGPVGYMDAAGTSAKFADLYGLLADSTGNIYVADLGNNRIRKIAQPKFSRFNSIQGEASSGQYFRISGVQLTGTEVVTAPAGFEVSLSTDSGFASSLSFAPVNGEVTNKKVYIRLSASAAAGDYTGNIILSSGGAVSKYMAVGGTVKNMALLPLVTFDPVTVSSYAGNGVQGFADGTSINAQFNTPYGVAADAAGNMYVADFNNNRIRKITPQGMVTTLAGSGIAGFSDGTGNTAQFHHPTGLACDAAGNILVADRENNRIRKVSPNGIVTTLAGNGTAGFANGAGNVAQFNSPYAVCVDAAGNVFVADQYNNRIRKITPAGIVTTVAGDGILGTQDGKGSQARFAEPNGIAADALGNVYVTEFYGSLRKITSAGVVTSFKAPVLDGFHQGVAADSSGCMYVSDINPVSGKQVIIKVTPFGIASVMAGNASGYMNAMGKGARFNQPVGITLDKTGNLYVADANNNRVRKIALPKTVPFKTTMGIASSGQYFTVSGVHLTANEYVVAPEGFEISFNLNAGFMQQFFFAPLAGDVCNFQVYVRLGAAALPGTYTGNVTLSSAGAVTKYLPVTGTVTAAAFTANVVADKSIQVYPNPNKGTFRLQLNNLDAAVMEVRITAQDGKIILQQKLSGLSKIQTIPLNAGTIANGVYTVEAIGKNKVYTAKMVVQQ